MAQIVYVIDPTTGRPLHPFLVKFEAHVEAIDPEGTLKIRIDVAGRKYNLAPIVKRFLYFSCEARVSPDKTQVTAIEPGRLFNKDTYCMPDTAIPLHEARVDLEIASKPSEARFFARIYQSLPRVTDPAYTTRIQELKQACTRYNRMVVDLRHIYARKFFQPIFLKAKIHQDQLIFSHYQGIYLPVPLQPGRHCFQVKVVPIY